MSKLLEKIRNAVKNGDILISSSGQDKMGYEHISTKEIISSIDEAELISEYPEYDKGPCVLLLQCDAGKNPLHVVWGIPKDRDLPAILVIGDRLTT